MEDSEQQSLEHDSQPIVKKQMEDSPSRSQPGAEAHEEVGRRAEGAPLIDELLGATSSGVANAEPRLVGE